MINRLAGAGRGGAVVTRRCAALALALFTAGAMLYVVPKPRAAERFVASVRPPELPQDWQAEYDEEWREDAPEGCAH